MDNNQSLYYLLVGIDEYRNTPLRGCVNDVNKMETYLQSLSTSDAFADIHPMKLINTQATKTAIVKGIQNHLSKAKDTDVVLFYYSGHGANEDAGGLFRDELDGLLECMVCYNETNIASGFLLADKELRYLFSKMPNNPHFVTVFDSCHSGDITRDSGDDEKVAIKRLSGAFNARSYDEFLFSSDIRKADLQKTDISDLIPNKNTVHIAGCLSHESSWEKGGSGVFTSYLLQLLEATKNKINYLDIARYAKISLRNITHTQQTPTINTLGDGKTNHLSPWLNMHKDFTGDDAGMLTHHEKDGWVFTHGALMGIEKGVALTITRDDKTFNTRIKTVFPSFSKVEPLPGMESWDITKKFQAYTHTLYAPLKIYINNLDRNVEDVISSIESLVKDMKNIDLVGREEAGFDLNIFNQLVYFSKNGDPYRPIAKAYNLLDSKLDLKSFLKDQFKFLIRWNHFNTLINPTHPFESVSDGKNRKPIKVTFHLEGEKGGSTVKKDPVDITESEIEFLPVLKRHPQKHYFYNRYRVEIENTSDQILYVGILRLGSDLSIDCYGNGETIRLEPGITQAIYPTHPEKKIRRASFYPYQECYNWRYEEIIFKFILNTNDFTPAFKEMSQPHIELPDVPDCPGAGKFRDAIRLSRSSMAKPSPWDVYTSTLRLKNPLENLFQGRFLKCPNVLAEDPIFTPFIKKLYFSEKLNGFQLESNLKAAGRIADKFHDPKESKRIIDMMTGYDLDHIFETLQNRRQFKYDSANWTDKPRILIEGDEWIKFPLLQKDTLFHLNKNYPICFIKAPRNEKGNMTGHDKSLLLETAKDPDIKPDYVIIGRSFQKIFDETLIQHLVKQNGGSNEEGTTLFVNWQERIKKQYQGLFEELSTSKYAHIKHVFVHGYDYIGIENSKTSLIYDKLLDDFNDLLSEFGKEFANVIHIDLRGLVSQEDKSWFDALHPNENGCLAIANQFHKEISKSWNKHSND